MNNAGQSNDSQRKEKTKTTLGVVGAIIVAAAVVLGVVYLMFRDAPRMGAPGELDSAEGITPQQQPLTPAEPAPAR